MPALRLGLISDTHNLLRPEAIEALQGVDTILHLGDICKQEILDQLALIAPVTAIRGNNDQGDWAVILPEQLQLELSGYRLFLIHDLKQLDLNPHQSAIDVVLSGHSHRPSVHQDQGILYVNPGSAGPRRFKLPISVGYLFLDAEGIRAEIHELEPRPQTGRKTTHNTATSS